VAASFEENVRALIVCPACQVPFRVSGEELVCPGCGFQGSIREEVVLVGAARPASYFDERFETMEAGHSESQGDWHFAYRQQVDFLEGHLGTASTILDLGCGPSICYRKPAGAFLVGVEYSFPSVRANTAVDLRICGTAAALPLRPASVDLAVCFYSLHHMVGQKVRESRGILRGTFGEVQKVLRPGGRLVAFEMRPWWAFATIQGALWNSAKRVLGSRLDMYMWPEGEIAGIARECMPGAGFDVRPFASSMLEAFPPVFALPWLKLPRAVYPLSPVAYVWTKPAPAGGAPDSRQPMSRGRE
jgi:SAM-dependent methyltransferase